MSFRVLTPTWTGNVILDLEGFDKWYVFPLRQATLTAHLTLVLCADETVPWLTRSVRFERPEFS